MCLIRTQPNAAFVIKAPEEKEDGLWLCMQGLGKGQGSLCNPVDISEGKSKDFSRLVSQQGSWRGAGKKNPDLAFMSLKVQIQ